ncbi:acetyl-CoA synthetase [Methanomicrobium sp. W14]|uniref:acetate--CoA ligase n=1 Tax=Methanomicrobium sp. W14 TaxID=2817839 RepID=UPI001AE656D9|nr:acetate--CoA ligase [Methanomicrobium sp. W14]MBP2134288.1 acetyl-CoA synthetase [Methanomicrobium sp. W14]
MTEDEVKMGTTVYVPHSSCRDFRWMGDYEAVYRESVKDPEKFWENIASELEWDKKWDKVLEWDYPDSRWFSGAKLNITKNCLDRHVNSSKKNKVALIWKGDDGCERLYTYRQLHREVMRFANGLKNLGVRKGDRVCFYMPFVPEHIVAILACARIGAVHTIVYAGFGSESLHQRILDSQAKIVITADVSIRRGKRIDLKSLVDDAIVNAPSVERVVVFRRTQPEIELYAEMEIDYYDLIKDESNICEPEEMDAEDPLFILYTSGTTGKPKGILHTCGGYMVGTYYTCRYIFDIKDSDVYWCTADPGWITGHSYVVYGPLAAGATVMFSETTPDYPDLGVWWEIVEDFGVTIMYTAPTAIRMFMKYGEEWPNRYNLESLRILGSVGEPLNPEAFEWFYRVIGKGKLPIVDTWWQTETGMHMITTIPGDPMKPGFAGRPVPGIIADVVDKDGKSLEPGISGKLVIRSPWPSMMRGVWNDRSRYEKYWNDVPGCYTTGDMAVKDKDGYIMITGRSDDIIIMSGHNIGSAEVESALVENEAVAEAAVIGVPDSLKGNVIKAYVILKEGFEASEKLENELKYHVRMTLGPISMPSEIKFVQSLPKTRSGKIMRRVLRAVETGADPGDLSTIED